MILRPVLPEILPGERTRLICTVAAFMCVAAAALLARTVGDTLFLSRYPASNLSYMFIATAVVVGSVSFVYGSAAMRFPIDRLIVIACSLLVVLTLALRIGLLFDWGGLQIAAYLLADLVANIPFLLVWSFAGLVFNPREARRLFGLVGAGGTIACILTGFLIRPYAVRFGVQNLLLLVALLVGSFAAIVAAMPEAERRRLRPPGMPGKAGSAVAGPAYYSTLFKISQVRWLALLSITATIALTLADYQFKTSARAHFQGEELAGFFGSFYGLASAVALIIQLFVVHRALESWGILVSLCVLPSALLLTSLGAAVTSAFGWVVAARFAVQIFVFTIDSSAVQMLYQGVKKQSRSQARALVDGICKPASMAFIGISISVAFALHAIVGTAGTGDGLLILYPACACIVVCGIWFYVSRGNYASYLSALADSLGARRFDTDQEVSHVYEKAFTSRARQLLVSAPDDEVPYLLEILQELGRMNLCSEFAGLLARESPSVKIATLNCLREWGSPGDLPSILPQIRHSDPSVRAAAIWAASSVDGPKAAAHLERCLDDPATAVRAAAAVALSETSPGTSNRGLPVEGELARRQLGRLGEDRGSGSENRAGAARLLRAEAVLQGMLSSIEPDSRSAAATALARAGRKDAVVELTRLLKDSDASVRLASLDACRGHADRRVVDALIPLLSDKEVAEEAADVLAGFGQIATASLLEFLGERRAELSRSAVAAVPAILSHVGDSVALQVLRDLFGDPDLQLRREAIRAYCSIARRQFSIEALLPGLESAVMREMDEALEQARTVDFVKPFVGAEVLAGALQERYLGHLENIFSLLDLTTPEVDMNTLFLALTDGTEENHANVVEILDNVVRSDVKPRLLKLIEPAKGKEEAETEASAITTQYEDRIRTLLGGDSSEWVRAGALYSIARNGLSNMEAQIEVALSSDSPLIRETALYAMGAVSTSGSLRKWCPRLARDPDPGVRRLADSLLQEQEEALILP